MPGNEAVHLASGTFTESTTASFIGACDCSMAWGDYDPRRPPGPVVAGIGDAGAGSLPASTTKRRRHYTYISAGISGAAGRVRGMGRRGQRWAAGPGRHRHRNQPVRVFHNNGDGTFTAAAHAQLTSRLSSTRVGRLRQRRRPGPSRRQGGGIAPEHRLQQVYTTTGRELTSESSASLTGLNSPSLAWGDCDNDRDVDLACCGLSGKGALYSTRILYTNNGNGTSPMPATIHRRGGTGRLRCGRATTRTSVSIWRSIRPDVRGLRGGDQQKHRLCL